MNRLILLLFICFLAESCAPLPGETDSVPGPSAFVSRAETIQIAYAYTQVRWTPETKNVQHAHDPDGIQVNTPDRTLRRHGHSNGWWTPGIEQVSMPYQWGGFDTPKTFLRKQKAGLAAGDIATSQKIKLGDAVVSQYACGIDCSGFVSRCWRLERPYSTAELPTLTSPIPWSDLKPGDILLIRGHVLLFAGWANANKSILAYEAGPFPAWKVSAARMNVEKLKRMGYQPRRYHNIVDSF